MTTRDELVAVAFREWDAFCHSPEIDLEPQLDRALRGFGFVVDALLMHDVRALGRERLATEIRRAFDLYAGEQWRAIDKISVFLAAHVADAILEGPP